eukprot:ctg_708.g347
MQVMAPGKKPVLNRHYAFISPAAVPRGVSGADRAVCPGNARSWRRCGVARLQGAVDEKDVVAQYFNSNGFERWRKIYSETAEVNRVQRDIRDGHRQTVEAVLHMLDEDGTDYAQHTFCDAGCGVGSLALPLAQRNAKRVTAFDISEAMVNEARRRADELLPPEQRARCDFRVADVEGFRRGDAAAPVQHGALAHDHHFRAQDTLLRAAEEGGRVVPGPQPSHPRVPTFRSGHSSRAAAVGVAVGGGAGARYAKRLGMPINARERRNLRRGVRQSVFLRDLAFTLSRALAGMAVFPREAVARAVAAATPRARDAESPATLAAATGSDPSWRRATAPPPASRKTPRIGAPPSYKSRARSPCGPQSVAGCATLGQHSFASLRLHSPLFVFCTRFVVARPGTAVSSRPRLRVTVPGALFAGATPSFTTSLALIPLARVEAVPRGHTAHHFVHEQHHLAGVGVVVVAGRLVCGDLVGQFRADARRVATAARRPVARVVSRVATGRVDSFYRLWCFRLPVECSVGASATRCQRQHGPVGSWHRVGVERRADGQRSGRQPQRRQTTTVCGRGRRRAGGGLACAVIGVAECDAVAGRGEHTVAADGRWSQRVDRHAAGFGAGDAAGHGAGGGAAVPVGGLCGQRGGLGGRCGRLRSRPPPAAYRSCGYIDVVV